jgi:hypothetical protein
MNLSVRENIKKPVKRTAKTYDNNKHVIVMNAIRNLECLCILKINTQPLHEGVVTVGSE